MKESRPTSYKNANYLPTGYYLQANPEIAGCSCVNLYSISLWDERIGITNTNFM